MRRPSVRCTPNTVTISVPTWTQDASHGRKQILGPPGALIACSVQPASSDDTATFEREQGNLYHRVIFHDEPVAPLRSVITWVDRGNRSLIVRSVRQEASGHNRSWIVVCEEKPLGGAA